MAKTDNAPRKEPKNPHLPLTRRNYVWLLAGFGIILL